MSPLPVSGRTLPRMLEAACHRDPQRELFRCGAERWTVEGAHAAALGAALWLQDAGLAWGDRVAIFCSNRHEFLRVVLGCGWLGAIAVPINTACRAPQLRYYLADCAARMLVIEEALLPELAAIAPQDLPLEMVCVIRTDSSNPPPTDLQARQAPTRDYPLDTSALPWRSIEFSPASAYSYTHVRLPAVSGTNLAPGDPWVILYTSGTTGPSKGVLCPHGQLYAWGINTANFLGVKPGDILCSTLPLFHVNALNCFVQALLADATQALELRFSVSGFWQAMARHQASVGYLLGAMVPMLLAREPSESERSHNMRIALGPGVPPSLAKRFQERTGVYLLEGYGSTETNFAIAALPNTGCEGTMGRVQPGFHARVVDDNDAELPRGEPGELVLRADEPFSFSSGYFGRPEQTVQAWRNLWFHTGDRVVLDSQARFIFVDRMKDAIRRRGENISSYEVEQVLMSHDSIANAAVFPVRSELAEDEVMAALVLKTGTSIELPDLIAFCAERLPHFAVPRYIDIVDDLPRTENGKVRKVVLRERAISVSTWDREAAGVVVKRRH